MPKDIPMGEYEPDDSRKVTHGEPNNPIEPQRTGGQEDEARRKAQQDAQEEKRRSQARENSGLEGDQPQAVHNEAGGARPEYDQYEVNQAGSINGTSAGASGQTAAEAAETKPGGAQAAYGNSADEEGREEQDGQRRQSQSQSQSQS